MAMLQECPKCHKRFSLKSKTCSCGFRFAKTAGKIYWIEFYVDGRRRRERIGPNKQAAEQRLRDVLNRRTEGRYIDKAKNTRVTFDELAKWYCGLPQVKAKKSYRRDTLSIRTLGNSFSGKRVSELTVNLVDAYRHKRLNEISYHKQKTRPATINREIACLRHMLNLAEQEGLIERVPFRGLKNLKEHNIRDRILSPEEFENLLACCPPHTARVVLMGYYTAMRKSEILNLKWDNLDLKNGFIRLSGLMTKTGEGRVIPLHGRVLEMLTSLPRDIHGWVFTLNGRPIKDMKHSFNAACKKAGIENFRFHDLRHCAINNLRLAGNDYFKIMAISGHRTTSCFRRYNSVTEDELKKVKWLSEGGKAWTIATNMDTKTKNGLATDG
jgi:integrase